MEGAVYVTEIEDEREAGGEGWLAHTKTHKLAISSLTREQSERERREA
jgi:hypothetical protein